MAGPGESDLWVPWVRAGGTCPVLMVEFQG